MENFQSAVYVNMEQLLAPSSTPYHFYPEQNHYMVVPVFIKSGFNQLVVFIRDLVVRIVEFVQSAVAFIYEKLDKDSLHSLKHTFSLIYEFAKNMPLSKFDKCLIAFIVVYWLSTLIASCYNHFQNRAREEKEQLEYLERQVYLLKKLDERRSMDIQWLYKELLSKKMMVDEKKEVGVQTRSQKMKKIKSK
jgi:hypothetical protein